MFAPVTVGNLPGGNVGEAWSEVEFVDNAQPASQTHRIDTAAGRGPSQRAASGSAGLILPNGRRRAVPSTCAKPVRLGRYCNAFHALAAAVGLPAGLRSGGVGLTGTRRPVAPHCTAQSAPLSFERLEDRTLMATLTVNSLADNVIGGNGLLTLREAINAAINDTTIDGQTGSGADTIVFQAGLNGDIDLNAGLGALGGGASTRTSQSPATVRRTRKLTASWARKRSSSGPVAAPSTSRCRG